jgi:hypothetical protein
MGKTGWIEISFTTFHNLILFRTLFRKTLVPICFGVFQAVEMYSKELSHDSLFHKSDEIAIQSIPIASISPPAPVSSLYHQHFDAPAGCLQRAVKTLSIKPRSNL